MPKYETLTDCFLPVTPNSFSDILARHGHCLTVQVEALKKSMIKYQKAALNN